MDKEIVVRLHSSFEDYGPEVSGHGNGILVRP